jgi:flagellar biosynthesis chaperone FliJ
MARTVNMDVLDRKIEKAQQEVSLAKKKYDEATKELKKLLDKRDALRSQEILKVVAESPLSYQEVVKLIQDAGKTNTTTDE